MHCRPPGSSSVHGILQARILEWVTMPSFRGSSKHRNQTYISGISWVVDSYFTAGSQCEESHLWQGHEEGSWHTQGCDQTSGVPLEFPEHVPQQKKKNKNLLAFVLCFSTLLIFSGKKSTQGFSLLHLKGMFQLNPSDSSLACLTGSPGLLTACELLAPPNCERHKA